MIWSVVSSEYEDFLDFWEFSTNQSTIVPYVLERRLETAKVGGLAAFVFFLNRGAVRRDDVRKMTSE